MAYLVNHPPSVASPPECSVDSESEKLSVITDPSDGAGVVLVTGAPVGGSEPRPPDVSSPTGWQLAISHRRDPVRAGQGEGVAEEIRSEGGRAIAVPRDVADPDSVDQMLDRVEEEWSPVTVLVANAALLQTTLDRDDRRRMGRHETAEGDGSTTSCPDG
jgi:hypothetical protein